MPLEEHHTPPPGAGSNKAAAWLPSGPLRSLLCGQQEGERGENGEGWGKLDQGGEEEGMISQEREEEKRKKRRYSSGRGKLVTPKRRRRRKKGKK